MAERPVPQTVQRAAETLRKRLADSSGPYPSPVMGRGQYEAILVWIEREVERRG